MKEVSNKINSLFLLTVARMVKWNKAKTTLKNERHKADDPARRERLYSDICKMAGKISGEKRKFLGDIVILLTDYMLRQSNLQPVDISATFVEKLQKRVFGKSIATSVLIKKYALKGRTAADRVDFDVPVKWADEAKQKYDATKKRIDYAILTGRY